MAPIRPSKPHATQTKPPSSTRSTQRPRSLDDPYAVPHRQNKAPTKAHKRYVRHATLLSRLQRTVSGSKVKKQRRPAKKLVTSLKDLEDALPLTNIGEEISETQTQSKGKQKQKSLRSRPGALRRKEKLLTAERERFAKNLALMAAEVPNGAGNSTISKNAGCHTTETAVINDAATLNHAKWAAIRAHVGRTMETADHRNDS